MFEGFGQLKFKNCDTKNVIKSRKAFKLTYKRSNLSPLCRSMVLKIIVWFSAKNYAGIQSPGL